MKELTADYDAQIRALLGDDNDPVYQAFEANAVIAGLDATFFDQRVTAADQINVVAAVLLRETGLLRHERRQAAGHPFREHRLIRDDVRCLADFELQGGPRVGVVEQIGAIRKSDGILEQRQ